jgi:hypothetical protein
MGENTGITGMIGPRAVPGHRRDSLPLEVRRHVMRDFVETAALLPFVGATIGPEAINRF